jgi:hypothetical protein
MPSTTRELTWADVNFDDPEERSRFYEQERRKGGERAKAALQRLRQLGILDDRGELLRDELPEDMKPSADRDFGG